MDRQLSAMITLCLCVTALILAVFPGGTEQASIGQAKRQASLPATNQCEEFEPNQSYNCSSLCPSWGKVWCQGTRLRQREILNSHSNISALINTTCLLVSAYEALKQEESCILKEKVKDYLISLCEYAQTGNDRINCTLNDDGSPAQLAEYCLRYNFSKQNEAYMRKVNRSLIPTESAR